MKNISILLNVVLLIAVGVLYILHFSQEPAQVAEVPAEEVQKEEPAETTPEDTAASYVPNFEVPTTQALSFPIAYVNIDSISDQYQLIKDESRRLKRNIDSKTREMERIQTEAEEFLAQVQTSIQLGTATQADVAESQEILRGKEEQIYRLQAELQEMSLKGQQNILEKTAKNITNYLINYQEELDYSYVLAYQYGGMVLYKNDSLDITSEVLKGLNENYKKKK